MRTVSFLLAFLFLCLGSTAHADAFPFDVVKNKPDFYTLDIDEENEMAFIESIFSASERSFNHRYESSHYYSTTKFDIVVLNCYTQPLPIMRLWINYIADDYQDIKAVSFDIGKQRYTFTDIITDNSKQEIENGKVEELLILFGYDASAFILALYDALGDDYDWDNFSVKMTLYGKEEVTTTLNDVFLLDCMNMTHLLNETGYYTIDYLSQVNQTPMKISQIK